MEDTEEWHTRGLSITSISLFCTLSSALAVAENEDKLIQGVVYKLLLDDLSLILGSVYFLYT